MPPLHTCLSRTQRADHAFPLAPVIRASEERCSGSWQMCCSRCLCGRIPLSLCCEQEPLQHAVPLVHFPGSTSALLMQLILSHGFTETHCLPAIGRDTVLSQPICAQCAFPSVLGNTDWLIAAYQNSWLNTLLYSVWGHDYTLSRLGNKA